MTYVSIHLNNVSGCCLLNEWLYCEAWETRIDGASITFFTLLGDKNKFVNILLAKEYDHHYIIQTCNKTV